MNGISLSHFEDTHHIDRDQSTIVRSQGPSQFEVCINLC